MSDKLINRFIRYASEHTTSDPDSNSYPSTSRQISFMRNLKNELTEIGLSEVILDDNGYLTATIPPNGIQDAPVTGFIAHVDTSPDFPGKNVTPIITEKYDGDIINLKNDIKIDPAEFPELLQYKGQPIITADGTTLLGADDKAGVAEIITAAEILVKEKRIQHGKIKIAFTPDE